MPMLAWKAASAFTAQPISRADSANLPSPSLTNRKLAVVSLVDEDIRPAVIIEIGHRNPQGLAAGAHEPALLGFRPERSRRPG